MITMNNLNKSYLTEEEIKGIENVKAGLKIWKELANIVIDDDGNLEESFKDFNKGESLDEIYLWLESEFVPFSVGHAFEGFYEEVSK
jgi:hypothetical protein